MTRQVFCQQFVTKHLFRIHITYTEFRIQVVFTPLNLQYSTQWVTCSTQQCNICSLVSHRLCRVDWTFYLKGFGPLEQQLLSCIIWVPLQSAAFLVYPAFKVGAHPQVTCWATTTSSKGKPRPQPRPRAHQPRCTGYPAPNLCFCSPLRCGKLSMPGWVVRQTPPACVWYCSTTSLPTS